MQLIWKYPEGKYIMKKLLSLFLSLAVICTVLVPCISVSATGGETLPLNFENGTNGFTYFNNIFLNDKFGNLNYPQEKVYPTSEDSSINGKSLNVIGVGSSSVGNYNFANAESNQVTVSGITGLDKTTCSTTNQGFLFRIKMTNTVNPTATAQISILLKQNNSALYAWCYKGAVAYNTDGTLYTGTVSYDNYGFYVSANFDGFIFVPISTSRANADASGWKTYEEGPTYPATYDYLPDLSQDFQFQFRFNGFYVNGTLTDTTTNIQLDDIMLCSGKGNNDVCWNAMRQAGYTSVVQKTQPSNYQYPLTIDDLNMPFTQVDNVYSSAVHWTTAGISIASGSEALNGTYSAKVSNILAGNSRTELNAVSMSGITGFSTSDFSNVTGIMLRMKIKNDTSSTVHSFSLVLRQIGVDKATWLGSGAIAYDVNGNQVAMGTGSLKMAVPIGFDGFLFIPFSSARSEHITNSAYDMYSTNPQYMVNLANNYTMQVYFGDSTWSGTSVVFDDMSIYKGTTQSDNWNTMRALGYSVFKATQPSSYSLPLTFENYNLPFANVKKYYQVTSGGSTTYPVVTESANLINGSSALNGISYKAAFTSSGTYSDSNYVRSETDVSAFNGITGLDRAAANATNLGLMMRIKVPASADGTDYIMSVDISQGTSTYNYLGNSAGGYNLDGTVNAGVKTNGDINCTIPSGFDGYIYLPFQSLICVTKVNNVDVYARYSNEYAANCVDLSQAFNMKLDFKGTNWLNKNAVIDDMCVSYPYTNVRPLNGSVTVNGLVNAYVDSGKVTLQVVPNAGYQLKAGSLSYTVGNIKNYDIARSGITADNRNEVNSTTFVYNLAGGINEINAEFVPVTQVNISTKPATQLSDNMLDIRYISIAYRQFTDGSGNVYKLVECGTEISNGSQTKVQPATKLNDRCDEYVRFTLRLTNAGTDAYKNIQYSARTYAVYENVNTGAKLDTVYSDWSTAYSVTNLLSAS